MSLVTGSIRLSQKRRDGPHRLAAKSVAGKEFSRSQPPIAQGGRGKASPRSIEARLCAKRREIRFKEMTLLVILGRNVTRLLRAPGGSPLMDIMEFHVCQQDRDMRWIVRLDNATYGAYLDKEQAMLDAVEAARDAQQAGREVRVFLGDRTDASRIF